MSHTIKDVMERGEITEEEAYFILRFAGRLGYGQAIRRLHPGNGIRRFFYFARKWIVWFGGWERAELSQWDRGAKAWEFFSNYGGVRKIASPFPVSFAGHRITLFGDWFQFRIGRRIFVVNHRFARGQFYVYWSFDGTPPDSPKQGRFLINKRWKVENCKA